MVTKAGARGRAQKISKGRRASATPALTREGIVAAALKQIDEEGLESFSIRTLARRLSVFPTAIYWYVPTRNQLLAEVVALVLADVPVAPKDRKWREYIRRMFISYREALHAHPNISPLIGTQLISNASVNLAFLEGLLDMLRRAGFTGQTLVAAYNTAIASLVGFVTQEFAPVPAEHAAEWRQDMQERLGKLDPQQYPTLAANIKILANHAFILRWQSGVDAPLDRSFVLYTEAQIAALESLLKKARAP